MVGIGIAIFTGLVSCFASYRMFWGQLDYPNSAGLYWPWPKILARCTGLIFGLVVLWALS